MTAIAEIISLAEKSAPSIAALLGSPFAGIGIQLLENYFGIKGDNSVLNALKTYANPNEPLAIIEANNKEAITKLLVENTENARTRQEVLKDHMPDILAACFTLIYFIIQCWAIYSPSNQDDIISARLQDIVLVIVGYYFGGMNQQPNIRK